MSVSEKNLQSHIQTTLNFYSNAFPQIMLGYEEMNVRKGDYLIYLRDIPNMDPKEREDLFRQILLDYNGFIKTENLAKSLFAVLNECMQECNQLQVDLHAYTKIIELSSEGKTVIDVETLEKRKGALETIATYLDKITYRFRTVHGPIIDQCFREIKVTLNKLVRGLNSKDVECFDLNANIAAQIEFETVRKPIIEQRLKENVVTLSQLVKQSQLVRGLRSSDIGPISLNPYATPELEAAYQTWFENPSNKFPVNSINVTPEKNAELNHALFTLGITYIDPETKHNYGIISSQELMKFQGKEESKENSSENELLAQALENKTDSLSAREISSEDVKKSSVAESSRQPAVQKKRSFFSFRKKKCPVESSK
jgi:hypothetical protein